MRTLPRALLVLILATTLIAAALTPGIAHADTGSYTQDDGPTCRWFGSGGIYSIDCSGYSQSAKGYVSYSCSMTVMGSSSSWSCRDIRGNSWRGSN